MKKLMVMFCSLLVAAVAHGEVFKCTDPVSGKVEYKPTPCAEGSGGETVEIEPFDQAKIDAAQQKLKESLEQQAKTDAEAAKAAEKEREIAAQEAIANSVSDQTDAINNNTQAIEQTNTSTTPTYYLPYTLPGAPGTATPAPAPATPTNNSSK